MSTRKTFRFSDGMAAELELLTSTWKVDQTEVIRRCIHEAAQRIAERSDDVSTTDSTASDTELVVVLQAHIKTLEAELEARRTELAREQETALRLAENVSQAQTLHAADVVEVLPAPEGMTRMDHFRAIFRRKR